MELTHPSIDPQSYEEDPSGVVVRTWSQIQSKYDVADRSVATRGDPHQLVLLSPQYAIKVFQNTAEDVYSELLVGDALNELMENTGHALFSKTAGYIISKELPPGMTLRPFSGSDEFGELFDLEPDCYIYVFIERVAMPFKSLPDEPRVNENAFFELLLGIYYARRELCFVHYDIHEGNIMFDVSENATDHVYKLGGGKCLTIRSAITPKLIDFGKSVLDPEYAGQGTLEYKRFWNKSDVDHLASLFQERSNNGVAFGGFLEEVRRMYGDSRYATRLGSDHAANHKGVLNLILSYFGDRIKDCVY